jgi:exosortase A-associated hydrolase 1
VTPPVEQALAFGSAGETLVGVAHVPSPASDTAVVIVVGGPQYRAGSHRLFVHLARSLATAGYVVLRFDVHGMGDSTGSPPSFDRLTGDIAAAIDTAQRVSPGVRHVALWGLCDGASAALLYWNETRDARVRAMCLANPWVRSEAGLARTHVKHYYGQRLMQREFWTKTLSGQVGAGAAREFLRNVIKARRPEAAAEQSFQRRMARAWNEFTGPLLLLLSGQDYTAKEFLEHAGSMPDWRGALQKRTLVRKDIDGADHTFSTLPHRMQLEACTLNWLDRSVGPHLNG